MKKIFENLIFIVFVLITLNFVFLLWPIYFFIILDELKKPAVWSMSISGRSITVLVSFLVCNLTIYGLFRSLKKIEVNALSILFLLFAIGQSFYVLFLFLSGGELTRSEQGKAIAFCEKLDEYAKNKNITELISYDDLPEEFRNTAPDGIFSPKFFYKLKENYSQCCFVSTKPGNPDFGFVDCYRQGEVSGKELVEGIKIRLFGDYASCEGAVVSFKGKKECTDFKL